MQGTQAKLKSQLSFKQRLCMPSNTRREKKKPFQKNHMLFFLASYKPPSMGECSESTAAIIIFPHVKAFIPADILNENTKLIYQSFFPHHPMQLYLRCNMPARVCQLKVPQTQNTAFISYFRLGAAYASTEHVREICGVKAPPGVTLH